MFLEPPFVHLGAPWRMSVRSLGVFAKVSIVATLVIAGFRSAEADLALMKSMPAVTVDPLFDKPSSGEVLARFLNDIVAATAKESKIFILLPTASTDTTNLEDFDATTVGLGGILGAAPAAVYRNTSLVEFSAALSSGPGSNVNVAPRLLVIVGSEFEPDDLLLGPARFIVEDQRLPRTSLFFVYHDAELAGNETDAFFSHAAFENIHRVALAALVADQNATDGTSPAAGAHHVFEISKKCKFCNEGFPGWRRDNAWDPSAVGDGDGDGGGFERPLDMVFAEERNLKKRRIVMITDDFPPYTSFERGPNGTQRLSTQNVCSQVLDFSALFAIEPLTLIVSAGAKPPGFIILFIPFQLPVWILIFATLVVVAILAVASRRYGFFDALSILLQQSSLAQPILDLSTRLFMVAWGIGAVLLATYYSALFLAFQAVPPGPVDVTSVAQMVADPQYRCGMEASKGSPYSFIQISAQLSPVFAEFYRRLELIPKDEDSIEYFRGGKFGYVCSVACSKKLQKLAGIAYPDERVLAVTGERFYARPMGLGFPKGSPLREAFDEYLGDLAAGGFFQYWYTKYSSANNYASADDNVIHPMQLKDLEGHFLIWGLGCFVAACMLTTEIVWVKFELGDKLRSFLRNKDGNEQHVLRIVLN